jgi:hypothetical protein
MGHRGSWDARKFHTAPRIRPKPRNPTKAGSEQKTKNLGKRVGFSSQFVQLILSLSVRSVEASSAFPTKL